MSKQNNQHEKNYPFYPFSFTQYKNGKESYWCNNKNAFH